jgi:hypothetical protein
VFFARRLLTCAVTASGRAAESNEEIRRSAIHPAGICVIMSQVNVELPRPELTAVADKLSQSRQDEPPAE